MMTMLWEIVKRQVWVSLRYPHTIGTTVPLLPYSWILYRYSVLLLAGPEATYYVLATVLLSVRT
jgi:hypothetical protein